MDQKLRMQKLNINHLFSGGLITNYYCTSGCKHCLYGCSPRWEKDYIDQNMAGKAMQKILSLGCGAIHIGGGEPMLNISGLLNVADEAKAMGMGIHYVETNASWYKNEEQAVKILETLRKHGITNLLISMSPFHNEHIPFYKVKGAINACKKTGIQPLPWIMDFYSDMDAFDDQKRHLLEEYEETFGADYLWNIPRRYWTHLGGRAVFTYKDIFPLQPLERILANPPCDELEDTSHFHIDLYGNYIPGLCSGLAIRMEDMGEPLDENQYPFITMLYNEGIQAFFHHVRKEYGFSPQKEYLNKCHLCNDIRLFLFREKQLDSHELKPDGYYRHVDEINVR
ncbi:MAG: 4Fe-4S cluster-binding domain-containing protein [Bacteroidales bacterium]|nr:4Fe-4S cluster-binding domain-containing protein [Bacteroidales bacterium]MBS3775723.1 4Fe-4S cluster-binding domain-containing protein [Bacteroidales bacterium]